MPNFLEQLAAEWFEYRGYFVRRNIKVGLRKAGGYESELDVVAFNPEHQHLVHIEASMDASSWEVRDRRFAAKFDFGRKHIPYLFRGIDLPPPEQRALLVFAAQREHVGGGNVWLIQDLMKDIRSELNDRSVAKKVVPEQFVILRSLQFAAHYWK